MTKLLTEQELSGQVFALLTNYIESPDKASNAAQRIVTAIIQPQKKAHADMVIGKDTTNPYGKNPEMVEYGDALAEYDKFIRQGQRERNK